MTDGESAARGWDRDGTPRQPLDEVILSRFSRLKCEEPTRLAIISDPHVATNSTGTQKLLHETEERLRRSIRRVNSTDADAVLINGDLTKDGEPWNFERFEEIASRLNQPMVATPGEHDVPKSWDDHNTPPVKEFENRYSPSGYPTLVRVGGLTLIVLNSATLPDESLYDTREGAISSAQLIKLDYVLEEVENPIVAFHHTIRPLPEDFIGDCPRNIHMLRNCEEVLWILEKHDVPMTISGHRHIPSTTEYNGMMEVVAPSVCSYPQAHLVLDVDSEGAVLKMVPNADRHEQLKAREALLTEEMSSEELALIKRIDKNLLEEPKHVQRK